MLHDGNIVNIMSRPFMPNYKVCLMHCVILNRPSSHVKPILILLGGCHCKQALFSQDQYFNLIYENQCHCEQCFLFFKFEYNCFFFMANVLVKSSLHIMFSWFCLNTPVDVLFTVLWIQSLLQTISKQYYICNNELYSNTIFLSLAASVLKSLHTHINPFRVE